MGDKRKDKRIPLIYYLAVFDRTTDELVGYLADVSVEGIKVMCDCPVTPGSKHLLRVESFLFDDPDHTIEFDAECRWNSPDKFIDYHDCGFRITRIEDSHLQEIRNIIDRFGFEE